MCTYQRHPLSWWLRIVNVLYFISGWCKAGFRWYLFFGVPFDKYVRNIIETVDSFTLACCFFLLVVLSLLLNIWPPKTLISWRETFFGPYCVSDGTSSEIIQPKIVKLHIPNGFAAWKNAFDGGHWYPICVGTHRLDDLGCLFVIYCHSHCR